MKNKTTNELIALANSRFSRPSLRGDMARMELLRREDAEDVARRATRKPRITSTDYDSVPKIVGGGDFLATLFGE